jgi:transmembrane 9 superfamily protein 3
MTFRGNHNRAEYCSVELSKDKYDLFAYAIKNHYWYQMYADDLPIWGIVGEYDEKEDAYYLWTHKKFEFGYNEDRVVDVNLTSESKVKLSPGITIHFSYEVKFERGNPKNFVLLFFFANRLHGNHQKLYLKIVLINI